MENGTHFKNSKTRVHVFKDPEGFWKWNDYAEFYGPERASLLEWMSRQNSPKDPDLICRWTPTNLRMPDCLGWCLIKIDLGESQYGISIMDSWYDGKGFSRGSTPTPGTEYVENVYGWVMMSRMRPRWNGWEQMTKQIWKEK